MIKMNRREIMETLEELSQVNGLYGRVLRSIKELNSEDFEILMHELESRNFKCPVDLIMYIES